MVVFHRQWLQRESKKAFEVGQVWYLISMGWWNSWIEFVTPQVSDKHPSLFYTVILLSTSVIFDEFTKIFFNTNIKITILLKMKLEYILHLCVP